MAKSTVPGVEIGTRLPPYDFDAKPKGRSGDYSLHITLQPSNHVQHETSVWQVTIRKKLNSD